MGKENLLTIENKTQKNRCTSMQFTIEEFGRAHPKTPTPCLKNVRTDKPSLHDCGRPLQRLLIHYTFFIRTSKS